MEDSISIVDLCFSFIDIGSMQMRKIKEVVIVMVHDEDGIQLTQEPPNPSWRKELTK